MNGFISHIINRHQFTDVNVAPRLPGRFEPPAVPPFHAWQQDGIPAETMQTVVHSNAGKSTENNYLHSQDLQLTESPILPVTSAQKTQYVTGEENQQPLTAKQAAGKVEKTNAVESVSLPKHSVQNTVVVADINLALQPGLPLTYEPPLLHQQVKAETDRKTRPVVSPDISKPAPEKRDTIQPSSGITPVPVVFPVPRHSNTALGFSAGRLQAQQLPQVIKVFIGRIEVRAVQAAGPVKAARAETPKPKMSLDEYLNKRNSRS